MARPGDDRTGDVERRLRRALLGMATVICLALFLLWRIDNPRIERLRMELADAVLPGMSWVAGPIELGTAMVRDYRNFLDVYDQNRELRREIQRLRVWRETARALEEENAQLRALNHVRLAPRTVFVTGDVIADSGGPFSHTVMVNVGERDGVLDGSAAVDGSGLVGRVVGTGQTAARILLLTDFSSRVPVMIRPSGRRAILAGDGAAAPRLEFVDGIDELRPGDQVETSGDGGVFPSGLPVGRIIAMPDGSLRAALAADYNRLEFLRVLRYKPDTQIDRPGGMVVPPGPASSPLIGPTRPLGAIPQGALPADGLPSATAGN
ncbi:rod shape-determining protein MreC [Limibaculum sp. M0105]|uniref:Cell shape-determining protein MreC n=1 Tax=Thermohalobaculum xanthum TaxID=2753746 RepID=A0A8J7M418_9RHOB|nr:rod shape-determining protein MreC [Thermohalobaculum xanthum]MBK0397941.1 rod shape-determining protein MreC [Thermohalobaculum xanthum]